MVSAGPDFNRQYGEADLLEKIQRALRRGGKSLEDLTLDEAAAFSEFHIGGRRATRDLAQRSRLRPRIRVLDIGCGLGGPARTLATDFGCTVTGVDAAHFFCESARQLNTRLGLSDRIEIIHGDILHLTFDRPFDVVWIQHVIPNISDREALLACIDRCLVNGGDIVFHEIFAGREGPCYYPVPWADTAELSHLIPMADFSGLLERHGFQRIWEEDVSEESRAWLEHALEPISLDKDVPRLPGIDVLMGSAATMKMKNVVRNLRDERIRVGRGVWRKQGA